MIQKAEKGTEAKNNDDDEKDRKVKCQDLNSTIAIIALM